jgi:hypothetical protein
MRTYQHNHGGGRADGGDSVAVPEGYGFVVNRAESEARALCPDKSNTGMSAEGRHARDCFNSH